MAKKVRRVRQPAPKSGGATTPEPTHTSSRGGSHAKSRAGNSRRGPGAHGPATTAEDLREEYAYVLQDLRRVFILALAMFSLLIVLNLLLR